MLFSFISSLKMEIVNDAYYPKWNGLLKVSSVEFERVNKKFVARGPIGVSKFKGVCRVSCRRTNGWRSIIYKGGSQIYIGTYDNEYDAARAYDTHSLKYFGRNAFLNFPPVDINVTGLK